MNKLFSGGAVRGERIGKETDFLNDERIARIGGGWAGTIGRDRLNIIIDDGRTTGPEVREIFKSSSGLEFIDGGKATTPQGFFYSMQTQLPGVVVSASHCDDSTAGLKFLDKGQHITEELEERLEENVRRAANGQIGKESKSHSLPNELYEGYFKTLENVIHPNAKKMKFIFDCANGPAREVTERLFPDSKIIGKYGLINDGVGANYPEHLADICDRERPDFGFSFDGDADRVAVWYKGRMLLGDEFIFLATLLLEQDKVVITESSNGGLTNSLKKLGIQTIPVKVGERNILTRMQQEGTEFGGEHSGHFLFNSHLGCSDGMYTAMWLVSQYLERDPNAFDRILDQYQPLYKKELNVEIPREAKQKVETDDKLLSVISFYNFTSNTTVKGRKSNTESKYRVQIPSPSRE
ncbi:MAG: hypothetical protein FWE31_05950 [Firmicutes bacterium]|nr:hypothetical protein [Bacillota bacterium]